jgi:acyl-CoA synthetase (AMP-forming)/AMP-acid ligase II
VSSWNFADVWETVAEARPEQLAQVRGRRRFTWTEFDRRADGVASALIAAGLGKQAKVAQYLTNVPEFLESVFACWKGAFVPVNTNYRYTDDELVYLWDNADAEAVVFETAFAEHVERIRHRVPNVRVWLFVGDEADCPSWAMPYEQAASSAEGRTVPPWGRSGDDLLLVYTGGTTGMPKGVMWREDDLFAILNKTARVRYPEDGTLDDVRAALEAPKYPPAVLLPAPPLMHGTGAFTAFSALSSGGTIVLLEGRGFSAVEALDAIERERVSEMTIVGDAFGKPLLAELDAHPGRWDISSLWLIVSSGMMFSSQTKAGLAQHNERLLCVDTLGSSEAPGMAMSQSGKGETAATAAFRLGPNSKIVDEEGNDVVPGSGQVGMVALGGRMPVGYYKDPVKTTSTFRTINGKRWSIPGDFASVDADGTVRLLGRGSVCINTGGEKVYPEEVEEVLKLHPTVADAVVVGVPDDRFGEAIVAVVEPRPGSSIDEAALISHTKEHLAGYKAPKRVLEVPTVGRADNGKVDYKRHRTEAAARLT